MQGFWDAMVCKCSISVLKSCSQKKSIFSGFHLNIFVLKLKSWILMIPRKFVSANTWNKSDQRLEMDWKVDSFAPAIGIWIWHCVQHFDFCDRKYPSNFFLRKYDVASVQLWNPLRYLDGKTFALQQFSKCPTFWNRALSKP